MAEVFGIAGSAFGTISLILQLFKEVSQYLDDIDRREQDLVQARNYARNIQISLNALDVAISNASANDANVKIAIGSCKDSCVSAVDNLLTVVNELRGQILLPNGRTAKAKELCAKLKYPFKKQNMEKLEQHLDRTNSALQTILHVLQLNTGNATNTAVTGAQKAIASVNVLSEKNSTVLIRMDKTSRLHDERLSSLQQDVREILLFTRSHGHMKHLQLATTQQTSSITSDRTFSSGLEQDSEFNNSLPSIQTRRYQGGGSMIFDAFCSCKTQRTRYSRGRWGPFLLEAEIKSRGHHAPECPMSKLSPVTYQTKRVLNFSLSAIQKFWRSASKVSLSFTSGTGTGTLGSGQTVNWVATVDEESSPLFQIVKTVGRYDHLQRKDMHMLLKSCFRRIIWCYANHHASATDVDENGHSILDWALQRYQASGWAPFAADNMAELFQMLTVATKPATYSNEITSIPMLASVAQSVWFSHSTRPNEIVMTLMPMCNEQVGQHYIEGNWLYDDYKQVYKVFQNFSQIPENLEFGPLSRAILKENQIGIRRLLERYPSAINEVNYCGQSPIHLAIRTQNIAVLSILLGYADAQVLNAADNKGDDPMSYATMRRPNHFTTVQGNCKGCQILDLLLQSEIALFPSSLSFCEPPLWVRDNTCKEGQRSLIKGLAMRREKLKELAYHTLSPEERQSLNIHQAWILDKNAAQVQHRLEARGCHIPKYLEVYEDSGSLNNSQSIYYFIGNGELAEYAYQLGFHYSDDEFLDLICALAYDMSREDYEAYKYARINCSYFCWMVGQGMDVSSNIPTAQAMGLETELTAAHYFMANLGTVTVIWGWALDSPLSLAASEIAFSEVIVDKCHCWCSPGGCTPFVKLLEGIYWADDPLNFPGRDLFIRLILPTKKMLIGLCAAQLGVLGELSWIYSTIIRYYTFTTLGLRHACCCIIEESLGPLPEEEFLELQEEESILLELFQSLIMEFEDKRRHDTKLEDFFEWMRVIWAPRMREVEKYLASQRLTNQQLRDAELIGVVWESYGPKPAVEDVQEEKEGGDLWDAMNELDAIATDPERPMMKQ